MSVTHAAIATAGASLLLGTAQPLPLVLAVLGSQLPDIDTTTSIIGQVLYPLSSWIEDRYPHRSVTHSLAATVAIATVAVAVGAALGDIKGCDLFLMWHHLGAIVKQWLVAVKCRVQ